MKNSLLLITFIFLGVAGVVGAAETAVRKSAATFNSEPRGALDFKGSEKRDVIYGRAPSRSGVEEDLKLDLYIPKETSAKKPLPLWIWIHGGAFSVGDKQGSRSICQAMAAKGFVVATLNYRLGWADSPGQKPSDPAELSKAAYRAIQDANSATAFLLGHASEFVFDPNWVFVAGASAGASISLNMVYATDLMAEKNQPGVTKLLGPLFPTANQPANPYHIKAIIPMWGSLSQLESVTPQVAVPSLFFHGMKDTTVPYEKGNAFSRPGYPLIYGSLSLYRRMQELEVSSQLYLDPDGGHGVYPAQLRVNMAADFLGAVMRGEKRNGLFVGDGFSFHEVPAGTNP